MMIIYAKILFALLMELNKFPKHNKKSIMTKV